MATITTINGSDTITSSRAVINTNFSNVNSGLPASMTASAFNTETTSGTLNPNNRSVVSLTDEDTLCTWTGSAWKFDVSTWFSRDANTILLANYTWSNQGTATSTPKSAVAGGEIISVPSANAWRVLRRNVPAAPPWTATLALTADRQGNSRTGLVIIDSGGKMTSISASGDTSRSVDNWSNLNTWANGDSYFSIVVGQVMQLRIVNTGTNFEYYKKLQSDASFVLVKTAGVTSYLGATLSYVGFGLTGEGAVMSGTFHSLTVA